MPDPIPALETVKVTILKGQPTPANPSGITVDIDPFQVSKANDTSRLQVEWICRTSGFTIEFKFDSPFGRSRFTRSTPGSILSGPIRADVEPSDQNYRYSVKIGQDPALDPGGVVNP